MPKAKIISSSNNKGGVGKSTLTFNIANLLANSGRKVLVVDLDTQCNLSQAFLGNGKFEELEKNARELFTINSQYSTKDLVMNTKENLDIIPGQIDDIFLLEQQLETLLSDIKNMIIPNLRKNVDLAEERLRSYLEIDNLKFKILKKRISEVVNEYDYIFFDLPPSLSRIPKNAWVSSDYLLVPISDRFALNGVQGLLSRMVEIKKNYNDNLKFIFCYNKVPVTKNGYSEVVNKNFEKIMIELEQGILGNQYLSSVSNIMGNFIRNSSEMEKLYADGRTILQSTNINFTNDYKDFVDEFISLTK